MKTLGRNADNDLYLEAGKLAEVQGAEAQCAVIESIIQTQKGELQFDEEQGIDYFGTVLRNPSYIDFWAGQVKTAIENLAFVESVEDFTYRFDRTSSTLYWSMTVINTDDERLDLQNKKTIVNGSPGVQLDWKDVYDKPEGVEDTIAMVENMAHEAVNYQEDLDDGHIGRTTLRRTKEILNGIIFEPNDPAYLQTRIITFTFSAVPLGTVIDFANLRVVTSVNASASYTVSISDGEKTSIGYSRHEGERTQVFFGKGRDRTTAHTILTSKGVSITFRGDIIGLFTAGMTDAKGNPLPIFVNGKKNAAFPYLSAVTVGSRVPLSDIGDDAFRSFTNLQTLNWDDSAANEITLGNNAFMGCSSLLNLTWLPVKVKAIGTGCFKNCTALLTMQGMARISLTKVPDECFMGCRSLQSVEELPLGTTELGIRAFSGCKALKNIKGLPDSVQTFGEGCFSNCTSMTEILYPPESLETIGKDCFIGCTALASVFISQGVTEIGSGAFAGCTALTDVRSDASTVPSIQEDTFDEDRKASGDSSISIYVPSGLLDDYVAHQYWGQFNIFKYGIYSFLLADIVAGTNGLTLISGTSKLQSDSIWTIEYGVGDKEQRFIPSVSGLPEFTYAEDKEEATITIKGYIKSIAGTSESAYPFFATANSEAFPYLKSIMIEDSPLEFLGDYAFAKCTGLEAVNLGFQTEQPYHLGIRTFADCSSLTTTDWLTIGLGTVIDPDQSSEEETIYYDAFGEGCFEDSGIESLAYNSDNVKSLPAACFAGTAIASLAEMGVHVEKLGKSCFARCEKLTDIQYLTSTPIETLPDYCFYGCTSLPDITGIENIQSVVYLSGSDTIVAQTGTHVFEGCTRLTSMAPIAAASGITAITDYMFAGCGLTSLNGLTSKIDSLGIGCFEHCESLSDIIALEEISATTIPQWCFRGDVSLKTLIGCMNVTSIGEGAFSGCTGLLSTSGLGRDVSSIRNNAFQDCTGLLYLSMIAPQAPSLGSNVFEGVSRDIPLYIAPNIAGYSGSGTEWATFESRTRTIQIRFDSIGAILDTDAEHSQITATIGEDSIQGVWYVDYGDGTSKAYYHGESALDGHLYASTKSYAITLYGDITSIGSGMEGASESDDDTSIISAIPFLDSLAESASLVDFSTPYLKKIGDFSFCKYGQTGDSLELNLNTSADIGNFAFAKLNSANGTIGTISSFGSSNVGAYAFYQAGLDSSEPFTSLTTAGRYSFANNISLPDVLGFTALTAVAPYMFARCTSIRTTTGLANVDTIGNNGFDGCTGLTTIKDFAALSKDDDKGIRNEAFHGCENISKVLIAIDEPPHLEPNGFDYPPDDGSPDDAKGTVTYANAPLFVPAGTASVYAGRPGWKYFVQILSRAIIFTTEKITTDTIIKPGYGKIHATGRWTVTIDNVQVNSGEAGNDLNILDEQQTLSASDEPHEIQISGPVTSIQCSDSLYPIFANTTGRNDWLKTVSCTGEMEISTIGEYTFAGCTKLTSVTNMPSVTAIGTRAFGYNISVSGNPKDEELVDISGLENVQIIGDGAFAGCTNLTKIDGLGMNVTSIGAQAFLGCPLTEVQMFAAVPPTLASNAFPDIDKTTVPLYVLSGYESAYRSASGWGEFATISSRQIALTLSAPANLSIVGGKGIIKSGTYWAVNFGDGSSTEGYKRTESDGMGYMPAHAYTYARNYTIRLEGGITELSGVLEESTFLTLGGTTGKCLTAFEATDSVPLTTIGDWAFKGETSLSKIRAKNAATIGQSAFEGCSAISNLSGFGGVVEIGENAFYGCLGLTAIESLGPAVETIASGAFGGGIKIAYIQMQATEPPILSIDAFNGSYSAQPNSEPEPIVLASWQDAPTDPIDTNQYFKGNLPLYVPAESKDAYKSVTVVIGGTEQINVWHYFRHPNTLITPANWEYDILVRSLKLYVEGVPRGTTFLSGTSKILSTSAWSVDWGDGSSNMMSANDTTLPQHTYTKEGGFTGAISIEGNITSISAIDSGLSPILRTSTGITSYLTSVISSEAMPITNIGPYSFYNCTGLTDVSGFVNVTNIGFHAFDGCTKLNSVGTLQNGTGFLSARVIDDYAFAGCAKLPYLVGFPKVYYIGEFAFYNCSSLFSTKGLGETAPEQNENEYEDIPDNPLGSASFGAYAFANCPLAEIYSMYIKPPFITGSTFAGVDTDTTRVYVPVGSIQAYKEAPYWSAFYRNIMAYSKLLFKVAGLTEGAQLTGLGKIICNSCIIDWGDGSPYEVIGIDPESQGPIDFPSHRFIAQNDTSTITISGPVTALQGSLTSESSANTDDDMSVQEYSPLFVVDDNPNALQEFTTEGSSALSSIGDGTFYGCGGLQKVVFPSSLTSIGRFAFAFNTAITSATLPSTISTLSKGVFYGCSFLTDFTWGTGNSTTPQSGELGAISFCNCTALQNLHIYKEVKNLPTGCFMNTKNLGIQDKSVAIAKAQLEQIGISCFEGSYLAQFDIDLTEAASLREIGSCAFKGCKFQSISFPLSLRTVGAEAFSYCTSLQAISGFDNVTQLENRCFFRCSSLQGGIDGILSNAVGAIGDYCFAGCRELSHVVIPPTVSALGEGCFNCSSSNWLDEYVSISSFEDAMTEMYGGKRMNQWDAIDAILCDKVMPDGTAYTEPYSSDIGGGLTAISWEYEGVATVGAGCFMNCTRLTLPQYIYASGDSTASDDSTAFNDVVVSTGLPSLATIPAYCFYGCTSLSGNLAFVSEYTTSFGRFSFARNNSLTSLELGRDPITGNDRTISVTLSPAVFMNCIALADISGFTNLFATVPAALQDAMFYGCQQLQDITIFRGAASGIKYLGNYCFAFCTSLKAGNGDFNITDSLANITEIGDGCFEGCIGLGSLFYGLPQVDYYPYRSFAGCANITSIKRLCSTLPSETTDTRDITLEGYAFADCPSIREIRLDYNTASPVSVVNAVGEGYPISNDPFPAIDVATKAHVGVFVPTDMIASYKTDAYWRQYEISSSSIIANVVLTIHLTVPSGQTASVYGGGSVAFRDPENGQGLVVVDDTFTYPISASNPSLENFEFTNLAAGDHTIRIAGDITALYGKELTSSTYAPIFYTDSQTHKNTLTTAIDIGDNIEILDAGCFMNFEQITALGLLGNTKLKKIGGYVYHGAKKITSLSEIPQSVTSLGKAAFTSCYNLTDISRLSALSISTLPASCFAYCTGLKNLTGISKITKFEQQTFRATAITGFEDGWFNSSGTIELGSYMFANCSALNSLDDFPSNVAAIPTYCFSSCISLTSLVGIPNVTVINNGAFSKTGITSLTGLGNNLTTIGNNNTQWDPTSSTQSPGAFSQCLSLTSLIGLPASITSLGTATFQGCTSLNDISSINSTQIENLPNFCFYGCSALQTIPTSTTIKSFGNSCFEGCSSLTDLTGIPNTLQSLGTGCFKGCIGLVDLYGIHECNVLTALPANCFSGCSRLAKVVYTQEVGGSQTNYFGLPKTIANIGDSCFANCSSLTLLILNRYEEQPDQSFAITQLGSNVFEGVMLSQILVPADAVNTYKTDPDWVGFTDIISAIPVNS